MPRPSSIDYPNNICRGRDVHKSRNSLFRCFLHPPITCSLFCLYILLTTLLSKYPISLQLLSIILSCLRAVPSNRSAIGPLTPFNVRNVLVHTWTDPGASPDLPCKQQATNRLSYGGSLSVTLVTTCIQRPRHVCNFCQASHSPILAKHFW